MNDLDKLFDSVEEDERKGSRYKLRDYRQQKDFLSYRERYQRLRREESLDE